MHFSAIISLTFGLAGIVPAVLAIPQSPGCNSPSGCESSTTNSNRLYPLGSSCTSNNECASGVCRNEICVEVGDPESQVHLVKRVLPEKTSDKCAGGDCGASTSGEGGAAGGSQLISEWKLPGFPSHDLSGFNVVHDKFGKQNRKFIKDPAGENTVLQVIYPAGSYAPGAKPVGGTGFMAQPINLKGARVVAFGYDVFFPAGFNFVKGGKLPGMYGGGPETTGRDSKGFFSSRFMFRTGGEGEAHLDVPLDKQVPGFCKIPPKSVCNPSFGASIGRGAWTFPTGEWVTLSQSIALNTVGKNDGSVIVKVNGKVVIEFHEITWITDSSSGFLGLAFETFFGGGSKDWATPIEQHTLYKNFFIQIVDQL
ncbi:hypothetical protein QVD99_001297 [Batrachochytrium dendrobatidis]|nr:hypothetical protein QVD99_001297 [Batrachochytrium dendrobatidis]